MLVMAVAILVSPLLSATAAFAEEAAPAASDQDPLAPQNLRVVADSITATSATIEWDHDPAKNDIDVWLADTNAYFDWGNSGSKTLANLQPETTYRLYITWYERPATLQHKSNIVEFTTPAGGNEPLPAGATNLEVVEVAHNTVSLKWVNAPGIDDYWIWTTSGTYLSWGNSQFKLLGGLQPETTYSILIGPDGVQFPNLTEAQKSNVVTFTTLPDTSEYEEHPLTPPQFLRVNAVTSSSITLSFTGSPNADGYDYWVNGAWKGGVWDGSNQFTYAVPAEQQAPGTVLKFLVAAQNSAESTVSDKSNEVTIIWGQLTAPQDLQVVTANRSTVALGWAPTQGATSYEIYQDGAWIGTSLANRFVVEGLTEGQSYSFSVTAKNELWTSPASHSITAVPGAEYTNVTYYTSWSLSSTGRNYKPEDLDISQITHINYAFADLCWMKASTSGVPCQNDAIPLQSGYVYDGEIVLGDQIFDPLNFESFATIKANNPHLKLLVSVGGWSWSKNFSNMAADEITRRAFANSAVAFMREYGLDGLDIDWEYPVEGGDVNNVYRPEDNVNFTLLMKTVREAFDAAGSVDGNYYLLTIASAQNDSFVVNADLANSIRYLDFANIMTYDYSGTWSLLAHHNSPLYYDPAHPYASASRSNVRGSVLGHLNGGVPDYKLMLGIPYYGKGWTGCPATGQYETCASYPAGTWETAVFDYTDIEQNYLNNNGFTRYWNEYAKVAYVFNEESGTFISYNDPTTMMYTSSLVKSFDLAGVMSWEASGDRNRSLTTQLVKDLPINGAYNAAALEAPANVREADSASNRITIAWDPVEGATGYEVFINNSFTAYVDEAKYEAAGLSSDTAYTFTVFAVKKTNGEVSEVSPASSSLSITTKPTPPSDLAVTNTTYNSISVDWTASPDAQQYAVYLNGTLVEVIEETGYVFANLASRTSYDISVTAVSLANGQIANESLALTLLDITTKLAAPSKLAVTGINHNFAHIQWKGASGADGYQIYLDGELVGSTEATTFTVTKLKKDTTYTIEVVAVKKHKGKVVEASEPITLEVTTLKKHDPKVKK